MRDHIGQNSVEAKEHVVPGRPPSRHHSSCITGDGSLASFIAGIETSTACSCSRSLAEDLILALSSGTVLVNMVAIAAAHALA